MSAAVVSTHYEPNSHFFGSSRKVEKILGSRPPNLPGPSRLPFDEDVFGASHSEAGQSFFSDSPLSSPSSSSFGSQVKNQVKSRFGSSADSKTSSSSRLDLGRNRSQPQGIQLLPLRRGNSSHSDELRRHQTNMSSSDHSSMSGPTPGKNNVRVVGRGGQGSRLRVLPSTSSGSLPEPAASHISIPQVKRTTDAQTGKPIVRVVGRGGIGSQPRPLPAEESKPITQPTVVIPPAIPEVPAKGVRMGGRGGAGSRPRPVKAKTEPNAISSRKMKISWKGKGKGKEKEKEKADPLPPSSSPLESFELKKRNSRESMVTMASVSTILFAGDSRPASAIIPPRVRAALQLGGESTTPSTPGLLTRSSTVDDCPSSPATSFDSISESPEIAESSDDSDDQIRRRGGNKLARTLGDLPPHLIYETLMKQRKAELRDLPKIKTNGFDKDQDKNAKASRRSSLSSITSFLRTNRRREISSHSMSTLSDMHRFGLEDDFSDTWDASSSVTSVTDKTTSPIMFSPPTPIAAPSATNKFDISRYRPVADVPSTPIFDDTPVASPTLTLGRSNSLSHPVKASPDRERYHSHSSSDPRPGTPFLLNVNVPRKLDWLYPPSPLEQEVGVIPVAVESTRTSQDSEWSGEWNRADIEDVIRSLRSL